jgi:K+-sensing histidine kinase KdpD
LKNEKAGLADSLSDISHQLKTPLTSMTVMTDLLCDPALPDAKRKEFTGMIRNQLERIEWLVTSLLKLSRFDAGTIAFNKVLIPVENLLRKACAPLQIPDRLRKTDPDRRRGPVSLFSAT